MGYASYPFLRDAFMGIIRKYLQHIKKSLNKRLRSYRLSKTKGFDIRLLTACDINLDLLDLLERGVCFPHPVGIVISSHVKICDGTQILQNASIGGKVSWGDAERVYPVIGSGVRICAGAVVMGNVTIGDYCVVGANAVVNRSFPPYFVIAGVPARQIGRVPPRSEEGSHEKGLARSAE